MALKVSLSKDDHAKLTPEQQALYIADGDKFKLDVEGLEDVTGLKSAFEKTKKELTDARKNLQQYDGQDPGEFRKLRDKVAELESEESKKRGDFEGAMKAVNEKHSRELEAATKKSTELETSLKSEKEARRQDRIANEAMMAINLAKGNGILLMPIIRNSAKIVEKDGKEFIQFHDPATGEVIRNGKGDPASIAEVLTEWKGKNEFAGAFEGNGASGGGAQPGRRGGDSGGAIVLSYEDAKDPAKYREARDRSAKEHKQFMVEDPTGGAQA
jgi:vacuolar-type H+-ATPase subunit I/STV1